MQEKLYWEEPTLEKKVTKILISILIIKCAFSQVFEAEAALNAKFVLL